MPRKARMKTLRCPTCKAIVLASNDHFPFCSDRCRIIDLGKWASGAYRIPGPVQDLESGLEPERSGMDPVDKDGGETIH